MGLAREVKRVARGWRWGGRTLRPASAPSNGDEERLFPTEWARTRPARAARAAIQGYGLKPLVRFEVNHSVEGLDVLDELEPPVVFVANHTSHLDAPLLLTSLPPDWRKRTTVGAAADYFFASWWRGMATTLAFNAFPVQRSGGRRGARDARRLLTEGWNLLVFPQGTRSRDGWITEFHAGAASVAVGAGVPVLPVAIAGAYQAMPRGAAWAARGRRPVRVRFGRPVVPEHKERTRDFNDRVRAALTFTMQEDSTTWWDALRDAQRGEVPDHSGPEAARWRRIWEASRPVEDVGSQRAWGKR